MVMNQTAHRVYVHSHLHSITPTFGDVHEDGLFVRTVRGAKICWMGGAYQKKLLLIRPVRSVRVLSVTFVRPMYVMHHTGTSFLRRCTLHIMHAAHCRYSQECL